LRLREFDTRHLIPFSWDMAVFTIADRDAIKTALITAATEGVASVSVGGQSVTTYSLDQLYKLLETINADLAGDLDGFGLRFRKFKPTYT
jgi:hypothetical protein